MAAQAKLLAEAAKLKTLYAMANEKATVASATNESVNQSVEQTNESRNQVIDAKILSVAPTRDREGNILSDRLTITVDKTFETIDMLTANTITTNRISVHPYQLQIAAANHKVIIKLLQKANVKASVTKKNYGINPAVFLVGLTGAEIKFNKTFRTASETRYNGDAFGSDLFQTEIVALKAPALMGELTPIQDALLDIFDDEDDKSAAKLVIELAPKTATPAKDAVSAVFG